LISNNNSDDNHDSKKYEAMIRTIVCNDDNIVKQIENAPQTYNSILGKLKNNGTMQMILRRRIKRLLNECAISKLRVPGTRFGLALFCIPDHDYKILVLHTLAKVRIFYMHKINEDNSHVLLNNYWELEGPNWSNWVFYAKQLKIQKYKLRDGAFRLWE